VDVDSEDDLAHLLVEPVEVDDDPLVVPLPVASGVIPGVPHCSIRAGEVVEDEVLIRDDLQVGPADDRGRVEVEVRSVGGQGVPAQTDGDIREWGAVLIEDAVLALAEADAHECCFSCMT
jgi:hypothetical protein